MRSTTHSSRRTPPTAYTQSAVPELVDAFRASDGVEEANVPPSVDLFGDPARASCAGTVFALVRFDGVSSDRKPSGLPQERITSSPFGGLEQHFDALDGSTGFNAVGVRRVRNTFVVLTLLTGAMVLAVLIAGNADAAAGMAYLLFAPPAVLAAITQFVLWFVESD